MLGAPPLHMNVEKRPQHARLLGIDAARDVEKRAAFSASPASGVGGMQSFEYLSHLLRLNGVQILHVYLRVYPLRRELYGKRALLTVGCLLKTLGSSDRTCVGERPSRMQTGRWQHFARRVA
jgi:hypothetical protein